MATLLSFLDVPIENDVAGVQRALSAIRDPQTFRQLLTLKKAQVSLENDLYEAQHETEPKLNSLLELNQIEQHLEIIIEKNLPYLTSHLDISGADLIKIGFNPDQSVRNTLNSLLFAVISGQIDNNRKNLLNFSKKFKNSVDDSEEVP